MFPRYFFSLITIIIIIINYYNLLRARSELGNSAPAYRPCAGMFMATLHLREIESNQNGQHEKIGQIINSHTLEYCTTVKIIWI